ncbi:MAG: hypothetical protein ABIK79_13935 [Chloroflexota bacterium]
MKGSKYVRCRCCGAESRVGLHLCPVCGEALRIRYNWRLPVVLFIVLSVLVYWLVQVVPLPGIGDTLTSAKVLEDGVEPTKGLTVVSTSTCEPEQTLSPVPDPTPIATVTAVSLPTASPTLAASPTHSSTPVPTYTATLVLPTETAESTPAPQLSGPDDGSRFQGRKTEIILSWEAVGSLGEDEWYDVSLRFWAEDRMHYSGAWVKELQWRVPKELHRSPDPGQPGFQWDVTVMRQTGAKPDGGRDGVSVSPTSETRVFYWD